MTFTFVDAIMHMHFGGIIECAPKLSGMKPRPYLLKLDAAGRLWERFSDTTWVFLGVVFDKMNMNDDYYCTVPIEEAVNTSALDTLTPSQRKVVEDIRVYPGISLGQIALLSIIDAHHPKPRLTAEALACQYEDLANQCDGGPAKNAYRMAAKLLRDAKLDI